MKKKLYLFLVLLCMGAARPCFSQSIINTATTIILNNTCFLSSTGPYTLTINYFSLATNAFTGSLVYPCTVTVSGAEVIISVPTGSFPTVASTGFWNLSDTRGTITLTGGTTNGLVSWNLNQFDCVALPVEIVNFAGAQNGVMSQVNLTWQTELEQNTTYFNIYRSSTAASGSYYKIGQVTAAGNSSGNINYSFTDNSPDATNYYYLQMDDQSGGCTTTGIINPNCSGCHFTPPSPITCNNAISGATAICNLEDHETYQLTSAIPNYSTINWSVSPAGLVYLYPNGCNPASVSMIKTSSSGVATLTATVPGCGTTFSKQILIGVPGSLAPNVNATSGIATCESLPGATSYVWTLNLGSKGTTTYDGQTVRFYLPNCSGGGMDVAVTAACGVSHDGQTIWNSNCSGAAATVFSVSPNPTSGMVTITPKSTAVSMTDTTGATTQVVNPTVSRIEVYNKMGTLLAVQKFPEGNKQVSFNVYTLPADNYVLHIFYNNNQQTEVQQLSIRR